MVLSDGSTRTGGPGAAGGGRVLAGVGLTSVSTEEITWAKAGVRGWYLRRCRGLDLQNPEKC